MTEPEDNRDENVWGFLGDLFEAIGETAWSGMQVVVVIFCLLVPVFVFCFYKWLQLRYSAKPKG